MNTIRLENTNPGHSKYYEFEGIKNNGRFTVKAMYGRIGQAGQVSIIYDGVSSTEADLEFQKKLNEKKKKGYVLVSRNGKLITQTATEKKTLLMFP